MYFADYHVHSEFSQDAHIPMREMLSAAVRAGMSELCFTDHVDPIWDNSEYLMKYPACYDYKDDMLRELAKMQEEFEGRLVIKAGAEISALNQWPEQGAELAATPELDFIIGSVHNLKDTRDFVFWKYESAQQCYDALPAYLAECAEIARTGFCDVIGHIGYYRKYAAKQGIDFDIMRFRDELEAMLRVLVETGTGIEINTSGLKSGIMDIIPTFDAVKLYRELGGEIITAGSDSHLPEHVGRGIEDAYEFMRAAGFEYVATFTKHRPEFRKL